ncbi:hypothetical protein FJT64_010465 [Amphibalanus amphitrite]|uniref:Uncharacterized protein n=1 Tax=Amphibalanus amphitrite TaxID=1232801 RepID=A0A6A4V545_AMPAM|nr:hypothetical protein FJT64_010465 [Amphibalanus amphitrite]
MRSSVLLLAALAALAAVEATFILGTTTGTVAAGTAAGAAGLAALGGLALGVGVVGAIALASRRGKRSAEVPARREAVVWDLVSATDQLGCALKFVCLIQARPEEELSEEEAMVSALFGRELDGVDFEKMQTSKGAYWYAAFMGERFGADSCNKLFGSCPHQMASMLEYFSGLQAESV